MIKKQEQKARRKRGIRKKIYGTAEKPRLSVARSLKHIRAQIIDDEMGRTLCSSSSLDKEIKEGSIKGKKEKAKKVGMLLAKRAKEKGITKVVFDRGSFSFAGRIKALGEGARIGGLEF